MPEWVETSISSTHDTHGEQCKPGREAAWEPAGSLLPLEAKELALGANQARQDYNTYVYLGWVSQAGLTNCINRCMAE